MNHKFYLPPQVAKFLANPPPPGQPIHRWLFLAAKRLHACKLPPPQIEVMISEAVAKVGRSRSSTEIADAVRNSAAGQLKTKSSGGSVSRKAGAPKAVKKAQVAVDHVLRKRVIDASTLGGLEGLKRLSPARGLDEKNARWYVEQLFPEDPLVCLAPCKDICFTRRLSEFDTYLEWFQLIVPSPMSAPEGLTKAGKMSARSLDNVGPRHYLVTEFDFGSFDDQAAIIEHLSHFAPLAMVVFSGKKSLHAWWSCKGECEDSVDRFFRYAVKLGADPATWSLVQLCRLPEGTRDSKTAQLVYYFDPAKLPVVGGAA